MDHHKSTVPPEKPKEVGPVKPFRTSLGEDPPLTSRSLIAFCRVQEYASCTFYTTACCAVLEATLRRTITVRIFTADWIIIIIIVVV